MPEFLTPLPSAGHYPTRGLSWDQVDYLEKGVVIDMEARAYMRDLLKSRGLPTTTIADMVIIGFRQEELREALGLKWRR